MRITTLVLMIWLTGCASLMKDFRERTCNYDGAFEYGVNHARNNQSMNGRSLINQCPPDAQAQAMRGYRDGYISIETQPRIEINKGP